MDMAVVVVVVVVVGSCRVAQAVSSAFAVAEGGCGVRKSTRRVISDC